jgi:hypothetical protein
VTAERWVPIEEVKEAALLAWLATKQAQGWVGQRSSSRRQHHGCVLWHQYGPLPTQQSILGGALLTVGLTSTAPLCTSVSPATRSIAVQADHYRTCQHVQVESITAAGLPLQVCAGWPGADCRVNLPARVPIPQQNGKCVHLLHDFMWRGCCVLSHKGFDPIGQASRHGLPGGFHVPALCRRN